MKKNLVDFAREDGWRNSWYRAYLHVKRFVLGWLGFKTATWFSKDKKIISCDVVSDEVFYTFVTPNKRLHWTLRLWAWLKNNIRLGLRQ